MKSILPHKINRQLIKIFWITVAWTIISISQLLAGYYSLQQMNCDLSGLPPFYIFLTGSLLTGFSAGIIGGGGMVFLWEKWLRSQKYGIALFNILWSFSLIYLLVAVITDFFMQSKELGLYMFDPQVVEAVRINIFGLDNIYNFLFWLFIVLGTLIVLLVNDKYGPGVFLSFILGKYFQPKREERIFMFLDLRSSTTIAEKLGEVHYFNFINNVFKDVTPAILNHKGEIYQYVGDEIVISWKMNNGLENANCIQCFFDIQAFLQQRKEYYLTHFEGIVPEFKAGLHYGHVMAGEIGVVKRDIAFSGDVLNTTARIQSKCNELGVDILLSKFLLDKLSLASNLFHPKKLGDILLRGKEQKVVLYTL